MKFVAEGLRPIRLAAANSPSAISFRIKRRSRGFGAAVFASNGFSQEEVLQHKLALPPRKRTTANLAGYLVILRLRPSFDFDYLIKSFALWAWIERTSRHGTPPANSRMLIAYGTLVRAVAQSTRSISVASSASAFELLTRFDTGRRAASPYTLILAAIR